MHQRSANAILFQTERLVVRRASPADVDALLEIHGDPEAMRFFGQGQTLNTADIERLLRAYPADDPQLIACPGLVLLKPTLQPIGFGGVGYYVSPGNQAELLFIFKRAFWGRGLATELAREALASAFAHPEISVITATVMPANVASIHVLEKCGMTRDCYLPEHDRLLYRITRTRSR